MFVVWHKTMALSLRIVLFITIWLNVFLGNSICKEVAHKHNKDDFKCKQNVMSQLNSYLNEIQLVPNGKHKFPETIASLKEACKINKNVVRLMTNMAEKCMTGFKKNVMQVSLYSVRRSQKSLCRNKPSKEMHDLVAAGKCVNAGSNYFRKCMKETANNLFAVKVLENRMKIPFICCEVVRTKQCLLKEAKKVKECTEEHVDTIQSRFNQVSVNTVNLACGDYNEDTDRCNSVNVPKGVHIPVEKNKTLLLSMFELLDSLNLGDDSSEAAPKR